MKNKVFTIALAVALIACVAVVGTIAYITSVQNPVKNVFTVGNVDITQEEEGGGAEDSSTHEKKFTILPNTTMTKDAKITVGKTSSSAYIFAVIEEKCNGVNSTVTPKGTYSFSDYVTYTVNTGWTKLAGYENVYYLKYTAPAETPATDTVYHLLTDLDKDGKGDIKIKDLTDDQIEAAKADGFDLHLSFQSAAVQAEGLEGKTDAEKIAAAWNAVKDNMTVTATATSSTPV